MSQAIHLPRRRERWAESLVLLVALAVVVVSARPYAGSWNDGSRLATVESLIDRHTWSIDDSIFVQVPHPENRTTPLPYPAQQAGLLEHGTLDKLFIAGHFYSDKSPVPALWLAGWYQLWQWTTGETARDRPDHFCRMMTLASSGLAYLVAVWCLYCLGRRLGLPLVSRLLLTASFGLATVALPYVRQVNNHILLLAITSALALSASALRDEIRQRRVSWSRVGVMGFLAGFGYTIDLGAGPVILLCTFGLVLACCLRNQTSSLRRSVIPCLWFGLGALPWLLLHHSLNYAIGGSFQPANANPEYFGWPGCPFAVGNLTGRWAHRDLGSFLLYAASMLAGKRGFLGHNLPLFLTIPAFFILVRRYRELWPGLFWALGCCGGTWLLYAATSNNSSGQCCSIRWFVPLLAPGYFVLALLLRHFPRFRIDLLILSLWGALLVGFMADGPWMGGMAPFFWPIQIAALGSWAVYRRFHSPYLEICTQHPYTNGLVSSSPSGAATVSLWITKPSSFGARANTISATSTSICRATISSSSPA